MYMSKFIIHRGYSGEIVRGASLLVCPHCGYRHMDYVRDYCVEGRPDNSKGDCDNCFKVYGVIVNGEDYVVLKLYHMDDNIN